MRFKKVAITGLLLAMTQFAWGHGDVVPQAVDTSSLTQLGTGWKDSNPYKGDKKAIAVGTSAYNQNCARCHGLEVISGGVAPDLRKLNLDCLDLAKPEKKAACEKEVDGYFLASIRGGKVRNGAVYMPPFEGTLSQEAMWAIKAYIDTRPFK